MPNSSDVLVEPLLAMVRPRRIEWATKCGRSFRSDLQHRYSGIEFSRRDSAGGRVLYKRHNMMVEAQTEVVSVDEENSLESIHTSTRGTPPRERSADALF
jgi:hypothetical protein